MILKEILCSMLIEFGVLKDCNFACGSIWMLNLVLELKEELTLRVFENMVMRIFGSE
jgi:hypothetical protein